MKTLITLPADIDDLFFKGKDVSEENLNLFLTGMGNILRDRLKPKEDKPESIRMSKLGIKDRKLWFEHNRKLPRTKGSNALKFVYGDLIEALILFLAKESGHKVEDEQKEVTIDGVVGHQDAKIDDITIDVKSASDYAFKKFSERGLFKDDPFGYIAQLSSYAHADEGNDAAFIGVNKVTGQICILPLDPIDRIDPVKRIAQVKEIVKLSSPPKEKCYADIPYKTSDNMTLNRNCTYCPFAAECWKDANGGKGLRYFQYSNEVVALTSVVTTPRVQEITQSFASGEDGTVTGGEIIDRGALPE